MVEIFLISVSRMIEVIKSNSFFTECGECLKQAYDSDDVMVSYYRLNAAPVMISTLIDTVDYKLGWGKIFTHICFASGFSGIQFLSYQRAI